MITRKFIPIIMVTYFVLLAVTIAMANEQKKTAAVTAAENFLQAVDAAQYGKSWDMAAELFKSQVSKEMWSRQLGGLQPQFGRLLSRELRSAQYMTQLPGAPDGEYVVIQFVSSYERKKKALETVTPMLDHDGQWRVSGYFIK